MTPEEFDKIKKYIERSNNLQVGDLVRCPESSHASYTGLVISVAGKKVDVLGGAHVGVKSWDGIPGRQCWDMSDLKLLEPVNENR